MAAFTPSPVPVRLQIGDGGAAIELGDVTVALDVRAVTRDDGSVGAALGVVDAALLREQLANLLDHAACELRKGADDDAAPAAR